MKKKYALVLSGGGFKGAFQMGALDYLKANWHKIDPVNPMKFDIIAGVSVGALNGAMMAMDEQEQLRSLWQSIADNGVEEIYTSDFIDTKSTKEDVSFKLNLERLKERFLPNFAIKVNLWKGLGLMLSKKKRARFLQEMVSDAEKEFTANFKNFKALADNTPLREKLEKLLDINKVKSNFMCGFVSIDDGAYHAVSSKDFNSNQDFVNGVLASTAMPIIWNPVDEVNFGDQQVRNLVDGGIKNISPLGDVVKAIKENNEPNTEYVVIVINCSSGKDGYADQRNANIGKIALRSLNDIALTEIFNNDIDMFMKINHIVEQVEARHNAMKIFASGAKTGEPLKSFKSIVIQPDEGMLGDTLLANSDLIDRRIEHGHFKAEQALGIYKLQSQGTLPSVPLEEILV